MTASRTGEGGIFIALGANLPSELGSPRETLEETLRRLEAADVMIVGRSPWYASEPVPPRRLNRRVPRQLELICLKCLSKSPCERYDSAGELVDDLRRFSEHRPIRSKRSWAVSGTIR